jgi:uncharacterized protein
MFQRVLTPPVASTFLLGPRATGKSTWIQQHFGAGLIYDLLDTSLALRLSREPGLLAREVEAAGLKAGSWVVLDEVQKVPALLDEVHRLMQKHGLRFLLSGSSARKLKRGAANLLAGRALRQDFFPLVSKEIGHAPDFESITFGMLPQALGAERPEPYLIAYAETYIKEEVQAEALTRNVGGFARFLEVAARQNGMVTSTASIARDAQVARQTVQGYFDVLVDTLLGFWLPAWRLKRATKLVTHPKFYLFDAGVSRALSGRIAYPPTSEEMGPLFETYLLHELRAWLSYSGRAYPLSYFRTHDGVEVDILFESSRGHVAIEIKTSREWRSAFDSGFRRIRDELPGVRCLGVFTGSRAQRASGVEILPYAKFLERLWDGELID